MQGSNRLLLVGAAVIGLSACSSAPKKVPELSSLEGKKVALVDVEGEASARSVVEVALVNQLVQRGTFILVSKKDVDAARTEVGQDPTDWKGIARRAGADFALKAKVVQFDANELEGYSSIEEEDSQLAAERGEADAKTKRLFKVKSLHGIVKVALSFTDLKSSETRSAVAEKEETVEAEGKDSAPRLPPRLRFLEKLSNEAFHGFFESYN